jgi:hypothetical protein
MVGGLKFLRRLFAAPALAKHVIADNLPGPSVQSDDELLAPCPRGCGLVFAPGWWCDNCQACAYPAMLLDADYEPGADDEPNGDDEPDDGYA